tara:strand:+ start:607 stop:783 length:177 start_codon:yes stop_codon:yes gene_type:complete
MSNSVTHNNFIFEVVRTYLDKSVVKITPTNYTPTNLEDYPMFVTDKIGSLKEWIEDNY